LELGGKDATDAFDEIGHSPDANQLLKQFYKGELDEKDQKKKAERSFQLFNNGPNPGAEDHPGSIEMFVLRSIPILVPILFGYYYYKYYLPSGPME
jgi:hypothetical protein